MKLCLTCNFQTASEQEVCPRDGSSMVTVGDDPLLGLVIEGRYRIESVIGQGSAGTVYKAIQELIGREVAIKVLHDYLVSDNEFIKRFTQEARASSRLNHPNIITIYDFGVIPQGKRPYIAMDLLIGLSLSQAISEYNQLSLEEAIPIFKQVCSALGEAHRQGVIHRDVKPENVVLVERGGQKWFPIMVDFGIARLVQEECDQAKITRTGTVCGSPTYMSPEQCTSSKVDHRSDIYSLGIVAYEALTGEVPFLSDNTVAVMAMHLSDRPKLLNQVRPDLQFPQVLEDVISKALEKDPSNRFQSMDEFSEALDAVLKECEKPFIVMPELSLPAHANVAPGPLATSEELQRKRSRDSMVPHFSPRALASKTLKELYTSGEYEKSQLSDDIVIPDSISMQKPFNSTAIPDNVKQSSTKETPVSVVTQCSRARMRRSYSVWHRFTPVVIGLVIVAVMVAYTWGSTKISQILSVHRIPNAAQVERYIKQGRLEEALNIVKSLKQNNKLSKTQSESLNRVSINLAKQYAKEKDYAKAVTVLEQVPLRSNQSETVKSLLKRYRNRNSK